MTTYPGPALAWALRQIAEGQRPGVTVTRKGRRVLKNLARGMNYEQALRAEKARAARLQEVYALLLALAPLVLYLILGGVAYASR